MTQPLRAVCPIYYIPGPVEGKAQEAQLHNIHACAVSDEGGQLAYEFSDLSQSDFPQAEAEAKSTRLDIIANIAGARAANNNASRKASLDSMEAITTASVNFYFAGSKNSPPELDDFAASTTCEPQTYSYVQLQGACASAFLHVFERCAEAYTQGIPFAEYDPALEAGKAFVPLFREWRLTEARKEAAEITANDPNSLPAPAPLQQQQFLPTPSGQGHQSAVRFIIAPDENKRAGMTFTGGERGGTITFSLRSATSQLSIQDLDISCVSLFITMLSTLERLKTEWAALTCEMVLDMRGIKRTGAKSGGKDYQGAHRREDLDEVDRQFQAMQTLHAKLEDFPVLDTSSPGKKRAYKPLSVGSHFFTIAAIEKPGPPRWAFSLGPAAKAFGVQSPFSYFPRRALKYSPIHERTEKALACYFFAHHANSQGKPVRRKIADIIAWCAIPMDRRYPQKVVDRFDKAMCRLVLDGVLGWFAYPRDGTLPLRGWLDHWLNLIVEVAPAANNPITLTAEKRAIAGAQEQAKPPKRMRFRPAMGA